MRIKTGPTRKRKHNRVLKAAQGFRGRRKSCFKLAKDAVQRAMQFSTRDRKVRKREFRSLWIIRINAAVREAGMSYSQFIHGLNKAGITIDRKMLADLAINDATAFSSIASQAKAAL